jgi:hypothetical protein
MPGAGQYCSPQSGQNYLPFPQKIQSDVAAKLSMANVGPLVAAIKKSGAIDARLEEFERQVQEIVDETPTINDI